MLVTLEFQETLILAQGQQGREQLKSLKLCDMRLTQLRMYLRLIHRWHWLNDGQYEHVSEMVAEIGRLLGGWIKKSGRKKGIPASR